MSTATNNPALGTETPIGKVATALRTYWKEEGAGSRASLANFAVYSTAENALAENTEIVRAITQEHACRAILLSNPPTSEAASLDPQAWITAHCQLRNGKKAACSEQISFQLRGARPAMLRNIIFSNLDSDLPLILWWQGELGEAFDDRLYSVVDRLIVDSSAWEVPAAGFAKLQAAHQDRSSRFAVNDLSWSRSYNLRRALASTFEDPVAQERIPNLEQATIEHGHGGRVAAAMFAAWLGTRLGCCADSMGDGKITLKGGLCNGLTITLKQTEDPHSVAGVRLQGNDCDYHLSKDVTGQRILLRSCSDTFCTQRLLPADKRDTAAIITDVLQRAGNNRLYFQMVPLLQGILG